jgi:hypothetical protein
MCGKSSCQNRHGQYRLWWGVCRVLPYFGACAIHPVKMENTTFWQLVESTKQEAKGDQQLQEQMLISSLEKHEPEQIIEFECILREYLIEADHYNIIAAQKIIDGYVSDDSYLYFRCWLIGQGETVFTNVLQNPDSLASIVEDPYQDFEALLYVATEAFEKHTGRKEDDKTFPRAVADERGLNYDFGSETKGEDWTENQLPKMLPKLWKKFGPI